MAFADVASPHFQNADGRAPEGRATGCLPMTPSPDSRLGGRYVGRLLSKEIHQGRAVDALCN